MNRAIPTLLVTMTLLMSILSGCGKSGDDGISLQDIPHYPNAVKGESMEQSGFGGFMGGELVQFTTSDSFDDVVEFYTDALISYNTELLSNTSELGQQTVISIPLEGGMISVAIQEFTDEGQVNITFMSVGQR